MLRFQEQRRKLSRSKRRQIYFGQDSSSGRRISKHARHRPETLTCSLKIEAQSIEAVVRDEKLAKEQDERNEKLLVLCATLEFMKELSAAIERAGRVDED